MKSYKQEEINREILAQIKVGDTVGVNDWKRNMTVRGVSENFIIMNDTAGEYTILPKEPADISHNAVSKGQWYTAPDDLILDFEGGYDWIEAKVANEYLTRLENGRVNKVPAIRPSVRNWYPISELRLYEEREVIC